MAAIPSETVDLTSWTIVSIGVNQHERYEGFADTQALQVFSMSTAKAASTDIAGSLQSWTRVSTRTLMN